MADVEQASEKSTTNANLGSPKPYAGETLRDPSCIPLLVVQPSLLLVPHEEGVLQWQLKKRILASAGIQSYSSNLDSP